jgi:hypothetical protein
VDTLNRLCLAAVVLVVLQLTALVVGLTQPHHSVLGAVCTFLVPLLGLALIVVGRAYRLERREMSR